MTAGAEPLTRGPRSRPPPHPVLAVGLLCIGLVMAMSCWFSATAVVPELTVLWQLSVSEAAWLTIAVQVGFAVGAVGASVINLADILSMRALLTVSSVVAALANLSLLVVPDAEMAIVARFITGVMFAGIYPPAMKLVSTWGVKRRGIALGCAIAGLTLGSASPHLIRAMGGPEGAGLAGGGLDWQTVVIASSALTLGGALIFLITGKEGPYPFSRTVFRLGQVGQVVRNKAVVLATLGYFGHMWELYAMWAWMNTYVTSAFTAQGIAAPMTLAAVVTFFVIGSGAVGSLIGGIFGDRVGRPMTTIWLLALSGSCAALVGFLHDGPTWLLLVLLIVWGITVAGDSAQFSAVITERGNPSLIGTALTLQMGLGFGLTVVTIWILPAVAAWLGGWQWVFVVLVPGPVLGVIAMATLHRMDRARPA